MEKLRLYVVMVVSVAATICISPVKVLQAQMERLITENDMDTAYRPPIKIIADPSSYGPYYINTEHTNVYFVTDFPANTSKVIMKYVDSKGEQLGVAKIKEGSGISTVEWTVESEDVGFTLSPQLNIEVHYDADSIAHYNIPYIVYPDTIHLYASAGWGPFFSNNYPLADGWEPVAETLNTFSAGNLPPRTNTVEFQILDVDSSIIKSHMVIAADGEYLDTAVFANVRMDSLPLNTMTLRTLIWCEGGPIQGLAKYKKLEIRPQKAKLISIVDDTAMVDSIGIFIENEFTGQALLIDSIKYAEISNGPGTWDLDNNLRTIYRGPYSFDMFWRDYTIEAWLRFDLNRLQHQGMNAMSLMSVDSVWEFRFDVYPDGDIAWFTIRSMAVEENSFIFTAKVPFDDLMTSEWHHVALTSYYTGTGNAHIHFYFDGKKWDNTVFHEDNFEYIRDHVNFSQYLGTQPLYLGVNPNLYPDPMISYVTAMDEVRMWDGARTEEEVQQYYYKKILQKDWLVGYWNFDDLRNRLGYISDLSYKNNRGQLKKGATFIPQHPQIQSTPDSLLFYSSNSSADSVIYNFIDLEKQIVTGDTNRMINGGDTLLIDVSSLPDNMAKLNIREFSEGTSDSGFLHTYYLEGYAPIPIATPRYNWNTFYYSANQWGELYNSIVVSGLPKQTSKVELGFQKDDQYYNVDQFTENSIPYRYSLALNGTDNFVQTNQKVSAPEELTMSFWFKTKTTEGGQIVGFSDSQNRSFRGDHDRELIMRKDGSLRLYLRSEDSTYILSADNKYNDGDWHHVAIVVNMGAELHVDGCLVDESNEAQGGAYSGYWIFGRNNSARPLIIEGERLSDYFEGSICEISLVDFSKAENRIKAGMYKPMDEKETDYYYRCDEGKGNVVHDYSGGNDGTLMGTTKDWFSANTLSFAVWNHNMLDKEPGTYDFFARVFYDDGPAEGAFYQLGRIQVKDPFPGVPFSYNMRHGFGYFNEGTKLINWFDFVIDYTCYDSADWQSDFVKFLFFTPDHFLIDSNSYDYTDGNIEGELSIDMGDAPPNSYLSIEIGYVSTSGVEYVNDQFAFQLYINPMLAPIVSGSFGPFDQAIAPGTMAQPNTFIITTEILSDLNKVVGKFYDKNDKQIGETNALQMNDTTWHITYDMGPLSPPTSKLKIEYYLGVDTRPALVQGPFAITIHKTRPRWFDFLDNSAYHDIAETDEKVTFTIHTPLTRKKNGVFNPDKVEEVILPSSVQLVGNLINGFYPAVSEAKLIWDKPQHQLELDGNPLMSQKVLNLSGGNTSFMAFEFNHSQYDSCRLDAKNDLIVTQNFKVDGSISKSAPKIPSITKKIKMLAKLTAALDPIVGPDFDIVFTGEFAYASRLNLMTDTLSKGWGSVGNLDVDANPNHEDAYIHSASYQFYSGALGLEFDIGAKLLTGLIKGDFGIDGRLVMGWGHSYVDLPRHQTKKLKSGAFQIYGRFYIAILWGWYSENVWGPKMFYHHNFWDDDMTNCFPPITKSEAPSIIPQNASWPDMVKTVVPVHKFTKMPMPVPESNISATPDNKVFTWVERGNSYGERKLAFRCFDPDKREFSKKRVVEINNNALNNHCTEAISNNLGFITWAQTRYDNQSILELKPTNVLKEFVQAQDIYYAIYDYKKDSLLLKGFIEDDTKSINSGRAEANPKLTIISDDRVLITWQVADVEAEEAAIWYALLEKTDDTWAAGKPQLLTAIDGIATNLEMVATANEKAVITWLNSDLPETDQNKIMTAVFDGSEWSVPQVLLDEKDNYYNYQSLKIVNGFGGLLVNTFVEDSIKNYEKIQLLNWDGWNDEWYVGEPIELIIDSVNHLQLPAITIQNDGRVVIAFKVEEFIPKTGIQRISQTDLLVGNLIDPWAPWKHIEANEFVCDTTKQLADLKISWVGGDTLMILSNEYPMFPTNTMFEPVNGIIFGDPYMNLVLRSFAIDEEGEIQDVDESDFFTGIFEQEKPRPKARLYQNYPNPCGDLTTLTFDIVENGKVTLELYDINGNRVATLMDQNLITGRYQVELNTSLLHSGTYICRLTSGGYASSLRMIVK